MQMLTAEAAAREGDWDAVQPALRAVCARWPDSLTAWNAHSRCGRPVGRPCPASHTATETAAGIRCHSDVALAVVLLAQPG